MLCCARALQFFFSLCNQALSQACAFTSPFSASMSVMGILRQRWVISKGTNPHLGIPQRQIRIALQENRLS
jgi:hypothetical protein